MVEFEWDEEKNRANKRKHGVSFERATHVFEDPWHVVVEDRVEEGEQRWQAIGAIEGMFILLAVHTWIEDQGTEVVRLISARAATRSERRIYEAHHG